MSFGRITTSPQSPSSTRASSSSVTWPPAGSTGTPPRAVTASASPAPATTAITVRPGRRGVAGSTVMRSWLSAPRASPGLHGRSGVGQVHVHLRHGLVTHDHDAAHRAPTTRRASAVQRVRVGAAQGVHHLVHRSSSSVPPAGRADLGPTPQTARGRSTAAPDRRRAVRPARRAAARTPGRRRPPRPASARTSRSSGVRARLSAAARRAASSTTADVVGMRRRRRCSAALAASSATVKIGAGDRSSHRPGGRLGRRPAASWASASPRATVGVAPAGALAG